MSVRLGKLDGVDGVKVSLNEGRAILKLKDRNTVPLRQVRTVVEQGGFAPREARVTARAEPVIDGNGLTLRMLGSGETFVVARTDARRTAEMKRQAGRALLIEGVITDAAPGQPAEIEVVSIKPAPQRDEAGLEHAPSVRWSGW